MTYINLLYPDMKDQNGFEIHITNEEISLNNVMDSFKDINLNREDINFQDLPSIYYSCVENNERISIIVNKSLGVGDFKSWPYTETQLAKFENIYICSGRNIDTIIRDLERNSNNLEFIKFLNANIGPSNTDRDLNKKEDSWKEIISCAIAYNLEDEHRENLIGLFEQKISNFSAVQTFFGEIE